MADNWADYCERTKNRPVRWSAETAVSLVRTRGTVLELGAGSLKEAYYFLSQGFERVVAVDNQRLDDGFAEANPDPRLEYVICEFRDYAFTSATFDLIHASFSLPWIEPEDFDRVFAALLGSLKPGGLYCGQFFGPRDAWNDGLPPHDTFARSFHSREQAEALVSGLIEVSVNEEERDRPHKDSTKHWHVFHVTGRKP